jgi:hypothetical protein
VPALCACPLRSLANFALCTLRPSRVQYLYSRTSLSKASVANTLGRTSRPWLVNCDMWRTALLGSAWLLTSGVCHDPSRSDVGGTATGPVSVAVWTNSARAGAPAINNTAASLELTIPAPPTASAFSVELLTQIAFPPGGTSEFAFDCSLDGAFDVAFVWVDDHLVCQAGVYNPTNSSTDGTVENPIYRRPGTVRPALVRAHLQVNNASRVRAAGGSASFTLHRCAIVSSDVGSSRRDTGCTMGPIPTTDLAAGVPAAEAQRRALQARLARGWGLWLHGNWLAMVGLPSSAKFTLFLCRLADATCLVSADVESDDPERGQLRLGVHALDNSVMQMYVAALGANVSVTILGGDSADGLRVAVEAVSCKGGCDGYAVAVTGAMAWARAGTASAPADSDDGPAAPSLTVSPEGLPSVSLWGATASSTAPPVAPSQLPPYVTGMPYLALSLAGASLAFAEGTSPPSVNDTVAAAAAAVAEYEAALQRDYGAALAEAAEITQAAIGWNWVYAPAEAAPFPPVSRSWGATPDTLPPPAAGSLAPEDWDYVIFGWDNLFSGMLAGVGNRTAATGSSALVGRDVAYSSLIQAVRAKTAAGFVPNYSAGGTKVSESASDWLAGWLAGWLTDRMDDRPTD